MGYGVLNHNPHHLLFTNVRGGVMEKCEVGEGLEAWLKTGNLWC